MKVISNEDSANKGIFGVGLGRRADGKPATNALDLRLDLSNHTSVKLTFRIFKNQDEFNPQVDGIWFNNDGGQTFRNVFGFKNLPQRDYSKVKVDVDKRAAKVGLDLTDRFVIRFQQHGEDHFDGPNTAFRDGIYLDDVKVTGTALPGS